MKTESIQRFATLALLLLCRPAAQADTIAAAYQAGTTGFAPDPAGLDWIPGVPSLEPENFASEGLSPDGITGFNAWRMLDNSAAGGQFLTWTKNLTNEEHAKAFANGWNLKGRLRVSDPVAANAGGNSVVLLYGNNAQGPVGTAKRFILFLDLNAAGTLVATLAGGPTVPLTGVDPALYHLHEFEFNPTSKTVVYLVDGVSKASGYAGTGTTFDGIQWGTGSSGGKGDGYWNAVTFTIRDAPAAPTLVSSPAGGAFDIGSSITLTGSFSGVVASYEWSKDSFLIPNATGPTLTIPFAQAGDAGNYVLTALNGSGFTESEPAIVTIKPDITPPTVTGLSASIFASRLRVHFSEPLNETLAGAPENYVVSGGRTVTGVNRVNDFTWDVGLNLPPVAGTSYTLTVSGVKDLAANPLTTVSISATAASGFPVMANLIAAFHGGSAQSHPLDGVTWKDLSGNENHALSPGVEGTRALSRPQLVAAGLNGRDTFSFARGNRQFLSIDGPISTGFAGSEFTFFIVAKQVAVPTAGYFPNLLRHRSSFSAAHWGAYLFAGSASTSNVPSMVVSSRSSSGSEVPCFVTPAAFGTWGIFTGQVNGGFSESSGRIEDHAPAGVNVVTGSAAGEMYFDPTPVSTAIGRSPNGTGTVDSFDGEMAEMLIYAGALTAEEQNAIQFYLRSRYFAVVQPSLAILQTPAGDVEVTFSGVLQHSLDLGSWTTLNVSSPWRVPAAARLPEEFFRSVIP